MIRIAVIRIRKVKKTVAKLDVLVIGGGPAGVAAACTVAESGRSVMLCDQSPALGGAVHKKLMGPGAELPVPGDLKSSWQDLLGRLDKQSSRVELRLGTVFLGLDSTGVALIKDHMTDVAIRISPAAVIFATGAIENVRPVPGWHLPGVMAAGGLQVSMKTSGSPPAGKVLLAGSGPLLLAVAAQLMSLGNAPIAVIESGKPVAKHRHALGLPLSYLREAARYVMELRAHRVPWICGARVEHIEKVETGLAVTVRKGGQSVTYDTSILALHNGLQRNNIGFPAENLGSANGTLVVHAGDCQEILGGRAAPASGLLAGEKLLSALARSDTKLSLPPELGKHRRAQAKLEKLFQPINDLPLKDLPKETIICKCECKTVGDISALLTEKDVSAKEIKLNGRFGMGRCQGRYCGKWVLDMIGETGGIQQPTVALTGCRWPIRPVSISALAGIRSHDDVEEHASNEIGNLREKI